MPGLDSLGDLLGAARQGLGYRFDVRCEDTGANNVGEAVRAWRDPATNTLRLSRSAAGNWAPAPNVIPAPGMLFVREMMAAAMDGNNGMRLKVTRPAGGVPACVINASAEIVRFTMPNL